MFKRSRRRVTLSRECPLPDFNQPSPRINALDYYYSRFIMVTAEESWYRNLSPYFFQETKDLERYTRLSFFSFLQHPSNVKRGTRQESHSWLESLGDRFSEAATVDRCRGEVIAAREILGSEKGREKAVGKYPRVIRMSGCSYRASGARSHVEDGDKKGIATGGREDRNLDTFARSWCVATRLDKRIDRIDVGWESYRGHEPTGGY